MYHCTDTQARCRGCGKLLNGSPYFKGGFAYIPRADGCNGEQAKKNWYGGWVCSRSCDYRAELEQEESMPGHGGQSRLGYDAVRRLDQKWAER